MDLNNTAHYLTFKTCSRICNSLLRMGCRSWFVGNATIPTLSIICQSKQPCIRPCQYHCFISIFYCLL